MHCDVISTGGKKGNAVLLNGSLLFDCGVRSNVLIPYLPQISMVFLTHIHGDHFRIATLQMIRKRRPLVKFVCSKNLLTDLVCRAGVPLDRIVLVNPDDGEKVVQHWPFVIVARAIPLLHDVENVGWVVQISGSGEDGCAMYATDTHHIPVDAPELDLYMIEANYREEDMERRRAAKYQAGEFAYEGRVVQSHMSMERAMEWLERNADPDRSRIVFLHGHVEKEDVEDGLDRTAPGTERTQENVQVCGGPEH